MIKQVVLKINIDSIAMDFHESIIQDLVYIHSGILFSLEKNETMPFVAIWMDLGIIILREIS